MTLQEKHKKNVEDKREQCNNYWDKIRDEIRESLAPSIGKAIYKFLDEFISNDTSKKDCPQHPTLAYHLYYRISVRDISPKTVVLEYWLQPIELDSKISDLGIWTFEAKKPLRSPNSSDVDRYIQQIYENVSEYLKAEYDILSDKKITLLLPFVATVKF